MDSIFQLESLENFQNASQKVLSNLYSTGSDIGKEPEPNVNEKGKQELKTIISDCDFEIQNVVKYLNSKEWDQKRVMYFVTVLENSWSNIIGAAFNHYSSNYGDTVINFDWLLKIIFGSSELKTLKYPLLQLVVTTINKVGQQNRVSYDINNDMLLKMINVLENIN